MAQGIGDVSNDHEIGMGNWHHGGATNRKIKLVFLLSKANYLLRYVGNPNNKHLCSTLGLQTPPQCRPDLPGPGLLGTWLVIK